MKIGIDLSALQGPHRMRGIGSVLINILNNLPNSVKTEHSFIFFILPEAVQEADPFETLMLEGVNYTTRTLDTPRIIKRRLPGRLGLITSALNQLIHLKELRYGDSTIQNTDLNELDVYFQVDPGRPLPKSKRSLRKVLMVHDIIPYVLEWDYLWKYRTARLRGFSRKAALRVQARRSMYVFKYKSALKRADHLLANSEHTKQDFVEYFSIPPKIITVTPLGVAVNKAVEPTPPLTEYKYTSWGYLPDSTTFDTKIPFVLFVGGIDRRRKLEDLVTAFNRLRAQGQQLKLVLVGDSMQGPMNVATEEVQYALRTCSYAKDIIYLGFTNDSHLRWLYEHALAFVFPSKYEGFGLPVLEAMSYGTPIIAYQNKAIREVASNIPNYASNAQDIEIALKDLLQSPYSESRKQSTIRQALEFTWDNTSKGVFKALLRN